MIFSNSGFSYSSNKRIESLKKVIFPSEFETSIFIFSFDNILEDSFSFVEKIIFLGFFLILANIQLLK